MFQNNSHKTPLKYIKGKVRNDRKPQNNKKKKNPQKNFSNT